MSTQITFFVLFLGKDGREEYNEACKMIQLFIHTFFTTVYNTCLYKEINVLLALCLNITLFIKTQTLYSVFVSRMNLSVLFPDSTMGGNDQGGSWHIFL